MQRTELGKILAHKRIELDMTQAQMAEMVGVSAQFLSAIEHGTKKMPLNLIEKLIEQFDFSGCEIGYLVRRYVDDMMKLPDCLKNDEKSKINESIADVICDAYFRKQRGRNYGLGDAIVEIFRK